MEQFGDELPVVTLLRIFEHIQNQQVVIQPPELIEEVKKQFAKEFPGAVFPWNESFVLQAWQQQNSDN